MLTSQYVQPRLCRYHEVCTRFCILTQLHFSLISFCSVSYAAQDLLLSGYKFLYPVAAPMCIIRPSQLPVNDALFYIDPMQHLRLFFDLKGLLTTPDTLTGQADY